VYISDLERGVYNPTLAVVFELARALEVDPSELVKEIPPHARLEGPRGRRVRRR
jgi:transcriptional regulator with XRE-family HTH domain